MSTVVQLKRSETTGAIPGVGDIAVGELAVNLADGALYSKRTDGAIIEIGGGAAIVFVDQSDMGQVSDAGGNSYDLGAITDAGATTSTQYTDALARAAVSVTDSGGDGSLAYNSTTGVITYTGPSASDVRAHFSAGTGITITSGAIAADTTVIATKQYVDEIAQGLHTHASCIAATTTTLASISSGTVTYSNGTSGVGATLTTTGSYTTIDGVTLSNGMRILVKDEATLANNGIYVRTSATVLTRATDFDSSAEIQGGDFTFVTSGTQYNSTGWVQIDNITTVGTDPVDWEQFSGAGTYLAGTGLTLTGNTFSVSSITSGQVTTALGFTPYNATNPSNYLTSVDLTSNVSGTLPVGRGGTGVTTSTGTGNVVLSASPTFTGTLTAATISATKILPNVQSIASASTITPNADTDTQVSVTALAVPATIAAPSGTPSDGQSLVIRIEDNGTARALTWTTGSSGAYRAVGITLPTTTVAAKVVYIGCKYNSTDLRWDVIALSQEA